MKSGPTVTVWLGFGQFDAERVTTVDVYLGILTFIPLKVELRTLLIGCEGAVIYSQGNFLIDRIQPRGIVRGSRWPSLESRASETALVGVTMIATPLLPLRMP